jgi:assimilatory nitrate reductase catalytic subunit
MADAEPEIKQTTCPYCGVGCGVDAQVRDSNIIAVSGAVNHKANFGRLCVKGSALDETTSLDGRLLYPQIRGKRVSWNTAIDEVASGFSRIIAKHGPESVAFYLSGQLLTEDYYVANKLMKGFIGSANVDTNSRLCMASAVAGYKRAFGADAVPCSYEDLETCDLLVMVGSNAAWTHPVLYQRIQAAKNKRPQMRVVVVDPRTTATCDIADLHLNIKPGSDAYLFVGLLHYLALNDKLDMGYIHAHTEGFTTALEAARETDLEALCEDLGVEPKALETFFQWFGETERTVTFYSQGINQSSSGTDKCNAIINCHLATGRIGREGMGPFSITGQPNAMGGREVGGLANQLAAHMDFTDDNVDRVGRFWNAPNMATKPGLKAVDLFEAIHRGKVKAVWIMATNPVVSMPDADRIKAALAKCDLVVVSDCVEKTDTTAFAHILLPATGWAEKDGTVTNSERCISRQRSLVPSAGEARHDWQIVADVAARMGFGEAFSYASPRDIFCEHAALSGFENKGSRAFNISALSNLSDVEYDNFSPLQWPVTAASPEGQKRLFGDGKFFTANGRARFVSLVPAAPAQGVDTGCDFVMNTGRIRDQWHTMTRTAKAARLLNHIDAPFVSIHPEDARILGVASGDLVEIFNDRGAVRLQAVVDSSVQQGELFAPMHWNDQYASRGRIGALIAPITDPYSGQPESKFVPVILRKLAVQRWLQVASRIELSMEAFDFWVKTPLNNGFRYQMAIFDDSEEKAVTWVRAQSSGIASLEYADAASGDYRLVGRDDQGLKLMAFVSASREALPEGSWLGESFAITNEAESWKLLAGRSVQGEDKGRLICSCFEVGEKDIIRAIEKGANSAQTLGAQLRCGTNCGSCIPELKNLIGLCGQGGASSSSDAA